MFRADTAKKSNAGAICLIVACISNIFCPVIVPDKYYRTENYEYYRTLACAERQDSSSGVLARGSERSFCLSLQRLAYALILAGQFGTDAQNAINECIKIRMTATVVGDGYTD